MSCDKDILNAVATKSADGKTLYFKAVNPTDKSVQVELKLKEGFAPGKAVFQIIASDSLGAQNSLDSPNIINVKQATASVNGQTICFAVPAYSANVLAVKIR